MINCFEIETACLIWLRTHHIPTGTTAATSRNRRLARVYISTGGPGGGAWPRTDHPTWGPQWPPSAPAWVRQIMHNLVLPTLSRSPSPYTHMASYNLPPLLSYIPALLRLNKLRSSSTPTHVHGLRCAVITASSAENRVLPQQERRSADYQPPLFDYNYIQSLGSHHMDDGHAKRRIEELKEEVRYMFGKEEEAAYRLHLIDALRQLGVAYHFDKEIKDAMGSMPVSAEDVVSAFKDDLNAIALLFRLHREHGLLISQDVFEGFKDVENGDFKACLCEDIKGMLGMYEASHLAVKGEELLHEAKAFTTRHLRDQQSNLDPQLRQRVAYALELPLNFRTPRLHARSFIDAYTRVDDMNPVLLELATLDFNMVQQIHQTELKELSRWWHNLDLGERLGFARSRLVESFLFTVGYAFEPKYHTCREGLTKFIALLTVVDDIYDLYGSIEELELFTCAIDRWDVEAAEELPGYMKMCYLALIDTVNSLAHNILKEKGLDIIPHMKKAWKVLCEAYLVEAKWYHSRHVPALEEYMNNAQITIGVPISLTYTHLCVSQNITQQALECISSCSDIIRRVSMICRLWNDLGTSTAELKRGDVTKAIQCHIHENDVLEAIAYKEIEGLVNNLWEELNGDRYSTLFDKSFINIALNFSRMTQYMYQSRDGFGQPDQEIMDQVASLFIEAISVGKS